MAHASKQTNRQWLYSNVYLDDAERNTNNFWASEFRKMFPEANDEFINTQEESPDGGRLKFDRVVWENSSSGLVRKVVAGEDKKIGVSKGDIVTAENDVEKKALLAMDKDGLDALYCHTTRGTMFRTWIIRNPTRQLEPLFGTDTRGDMDQYVEYRTVPGQYHLHRLGSLVKNEPEPILDDFKFLYDLGAGIVWDHRHMQMQLDFEHRHSDAMAALLPQQEGFNAASIPQAAEGLELPSAMQADNEGFEEETSEMSETPTFGQEQTDDSYRGQSSQTQEQTQVQASSSLAVYHEVRLSVERKKKGTYIVFNHGGRSFRTTGDQWMSARDENNRQCYQWYSNSAKLFFRAYQWP
ncbi:uncharacterized protein BDZ83DRAFT_640413 [Colletotrichum acutatum]|uniref:Uncharacterized protein n=1 Tax=Glomerella acutata TaxID=27357 RepID=A0AAD8U9K1_GLOAC|nr:uncharacterized protein BDZ83DRAFT_640413 [Colletotrichum acutatum]KAK1710583.1 hypothetical protein BDZ83DRAFT_640413 [Colletotrichum acutatum]